MIQVRMPLAKARLVADFAADCGAVSRLVLLDRGEDLTETTVEALRTAASPVRLRLRAPPLPFRDYQVVHVQPIAYCGPRTGDIVLCRAAGGFILCASGDGRAAGEILGRVVAIQRRGTIVSLERGLLACLPWRWRPAAVDFLEILARLWHPLTPPLWQGSGDACLAGVRAKYGSAAEVRHYLRDASLGAHPLELALVGRHVRPGGRLLDIGCGAGREALAFGRAGFRVVGIDIAPAMIDAARENAARAGPAIEFRTESATELGDPPGSFDGAFCSGAYHHIPGCARRIETLRRVHRALAPGGVLILPVMYREPVGLLSRARLVSLLRAAGARLFGPGRFSEPGDRWMRDVSEASDSRALVFFHDFRGPDEVQAEIEAAGFVAAEEEPGWWVCRRGRPEAGERSGREDEHSGGEG
jgi:SAM-dependent methyltransferase